MKAWFLSLAPRERLLVSLAAVVVAVAGFYLLVWEPLTLGVAQMQERVEREQALAVWMAGVREDADALQGQRRQQPVEGGNESLLSLIDQTSREAGLNDAVRRIQPEGDDRAAVTLEGAGFNKVMFWLRDLEQRYGVRIAALAVNRDEEPGTVSVRMTLERDAA